ncbi:MAG: hypothetical protein PHC41_16020 [Lachnospiraceae bacterium]|nr:hypothetical protein [Lachnospiraceae bacterium]MDD3617696.1 hypothetical protein [Lachnospiraceae bacterium]
MSGNPKVSMASTNTILDKVSNKKKGGNPAFAVDCLYYQVFHEIFPFMR